MTWPRIFQELFDIRGLALATIDLSAKFEVHNSTHHEGMEVDTKYRQWGGLG